MNKSLAVKAQPMECVYDYASRILHYNKVFFFIRINIIWK